MEKLVTPRHEVKSRGILTTMAGLLCHTNHSYHGHAVDQSLTTTVLPPHIWHFSRLQDSYVCSCSIRRNLVRWGPLHHDIPVRNAHLVKLGHRRTGLQLLHAQSIRMSLYRREVAAVCAELDRHSTNSQLSRTSLAMSLSWSCHFRWCSICRWLPTRRLQSSVTS
jgi:hypothetical protein